LKREIIRETLLVPLHLLVQPLQGHTVEFRKITVEHHTVTAEKKNLPLDRLDRDEIMCGRSGWHP